MKVKRRNRDFLAETQRQTERLEALATRAHPTPVNFGGFGRYRDESTHRVNKPGDDLGVVVFGVRVVADVAFLRTLNGGPRVSAQEYSSAGVSVPVRPLFRVPVQARPASVQRFGGLWGSQPVTLVIGPTGYVRLESTADLNARLTFDGSVPLG